MKDILFSVGPVLMDEEILDIGREQIPYFRTDEFSKVNIEIQDMLRKLCYTNEKSRVITLTASGTAAMEASLFNCFNSEDRLLVIVGGSFGRRFTQICDIYNLYYDVIELEQGKTITREMINKYNDKGYTGLIVNAHETSTGVLYDLEMLGEFCKRNSMYFIVDAISSFLADEYYMDKWGIDVTIISSQKALALPPGISLVILSEKIIKKIENNKVKSMYFDFKSYLTNMERGQTPFTPAVGIIIQLHKALEKILGYGIHKYIKDIEEIAKYFRNELRSLELPIEIKSDSLSNCLTPLYLKKENAYEIYLYLKEKYNIVLCPSGGNLKNKLLRVGHIGNLNKDNVDALLKALKNMKDEGIL